MKLCKKCGQEKENKSVCVNCKKNYNKEFYLKKKNEILPKMKEYQKLNKEKINDHYLALWAFCFGFLIATRIDVGIFSFFFYILILKDFISFKKFIQIILMVILSFVFFNPSNNYILLIQ
jgi:uncharacterized membrane protein YvbJ